MGGVRVSLKDRPIQSLFSPDSRFIAVRDSEGRVGVWDIQDPEKPKIVREPTGVSPRFDYLAFKADGTRLEALKEGYVVAFWDLPSAQRSPRSEVRRARRDLTRLIQQVVTSEVKTLFRGPRAETLPIRFEAYGTDFLVQALTLLLENKVYSEKAGILPMIPKSVLQETFGEGPVVTSSRFPNWVESQATDEGRLLLDPAWLERLTDRSPRALYILLTALEKFQESREVKQPLVAVFGEERVIFRTLREALERKENGLSAAEKANLFHLFDENFSGLKRVVQVISAESATNYLEANDYGVATLVSTEKGPFSQLPLGSQFFLDPETTAEGDLVAVAFLVPSLLKAAQFVRGIRGREAQARTLQYQLQQIVPGARAGAKGFTIELALYIQQVVLADQLVEKSA